MAVPSKNGALRGLGEPKGTLVVIDPGKRTGVCVFHPAHGYTVNTAGLDELPLLLRVLLLNEPVLLACEDYHLVGGRLAQQQAGSDMPSAQGIGMCRVACEWTDTLMVLVQPNNKRAGHAALDARGLAAWQACRNPHERDAVDLCSYVLREMRRAS
jgi:hypothetical protein